MIILLNISVCYTLVLLISMHSVIMSCHLSHICPLYLSILSSLSSSEHGNNAIMEDGDEQEDDE